MVVLQTAAPTAAGEPVAPSARAARASTPATASSVTDPRGSFGTTRPGYSTACDAIATLAVAGRNSIYPTQQRVTGFTPTPFNERPRTRLAPARVADLPSRRRR